RLAQALSAAGEPEQAARQLREWLARHPDDAAIARALSLADIAARRLDDAAAHLKLVLKHQPDDVAALNNLACVEGERGGAAGRRPPARRAVGHTMSALALPPGVPAIRPGRELLSRA